MKIIVDNKIPFLDGVLEAFADVEYYPAMEITSKVVKDADALLIRTRTICDENLLKESKIKFIATATIGFDHIDIEYCKRNGIEWTNAPACNSDSVTQYIASALIYLSKKYKFNFSNTTIGIIGVGNVGSRVSTLASLLGMKVLLNDPPRQRKEGKGKYVSLKEIQKKADIISFHVPLNKKGIDKTHHLFDEEFLSELNPDTIIINSSRGEVVVASVLKKALLGNKIKACVLDVWENEPNIDQRLLDLVDIGTPHIAGYSIGGKVNGTLMSVQALSNFFGLGINEWMPESFSSLQTENIEIDCNGLTSQELIAEAVLLTYDIKKDDLELRKSIQTFEQQRINYPLRKEFSFFKISLLNDNNNNRRILNQMGFLIDKM